MRPQKTPNPEGTTMHESPTRRRFLKLAGASAASLAALRCAGRPARAQQEPADEKKATLTLGLASYSTRKFTLDETLEIARRVRLEHICLKSFHLPLSATAEECAAARAKVEAAGLDLYGGGVIRMADEEEARRAFDYAKAAGMRTIIGVPAPPVLPLVNELVQKYDIRVAIHNHGPGDKTYPTPESAIERIQDLDPRIGLCIDVGHTVRAGACPVEDAKRFAERVLDVHMKDVSEAAPGGKEVEVGRGVVDVAGFLKTLMEIGYSGVVAFEYEKDPENLLPGLAESVGYVRGVLAAL